MPRLLTLGCLLVPLAVAFAAEPPVVPSLYPTSQPGSLSQSLPSLVSGSMSTVPTVPPPVMVSQPSWGGASCTPATCPAPACPAPACPAPACVARQPLLVSRVHRLPVPLATGCNSRGSLLERLRAWLCGGPGPAVTSGCVFAPPVRPVRDWGWRDTTICGSAAACGAPSQCDARGGRLFPMGRVFGRTAESCQTGACPPVGPRPIHIPMATAYDRSADCARPRPGLLRRIWNFFTSGLFGGDDCCVTTAGYGTTYSYGGGYDVPCATPVIGGGYTQPLLAPGNPYPAQPQPPVTQPLTVVQPQPRVAQVRPTAAPTPPVQSGLAGGYHFATSEVKPVSVVPTVNITPVPKTSMPQPTMQPGIQPASATQPLTRQR